MRAVIAVATIFVLAGVASLVAGAFAFSRTADLEALGFSAVGFCLVFAGERAARAGAGGA